MNTMSESNEAIGLQSMFFDPALSANPHPLFKQMRAMGSIVPIPAGFMMGTQQAWIVTQFEEAVQVLKDRRFTVDATTIDPNLRPFGRMAENASAAPTFAQERTMINVDEPDHSRLRNLVSKAFTPRYIESLRPRIQMLADELLDRVQPQGTMDVVQDYAYPLPINVISDMLGVPAEYRAQIRHWSQIIAGNFADRSPERAEQINAYSEYVAQLVEEKRRNPQDDLISQLVQIEEAGDHLSERELVAMVDLLIFAGHETTSNLIGIGTLMFLDHPDQMAKLIADPTLIPAAIEELLRFNGPVTMIAPRFAIEDVEVGGQTIHRGDTVLIFVSSANRDEKQFTDPDELDVARSLNRHIAFGQGIHYCLGAPLARLEGEIAFTTLLRRMPDIHLSVPRESITWRGGFALRGLTALPVAF